MNSRIDNSIGGTALFTETQVKLFVETWYARLDVHPPVAELLSMLDDNELRMQLPETTLRGLADFAIWYDGVIHRFFNEVHVLKEVGIRMTETQADVHIVLNWQAYTWQAPAAKSQWVGFDATQRWIVKRSAQTQQPVIATYTVEKFVPMANSAPLP